MGAPHPTAKCCWCGSPLRPICPYTDAQGKTKYRFFRCPDSAHFARQRVYWVLNATDILFIPLPHQTQALEAIAPVDADGKIRPRSAKNFLLLGSRGSSKSHLLRWLGHWLAINIPDFRILLLRRTLTELEDSQLAEVEYEAPKLGAKLSSKFELYYPTGSLMRFGHCAEEGDEKRYLGNQWDIILVDEEVTFSQAQLTDLMQAARPGSRTPANWVPCMVGGTNTVGICARFLRMIFETKVVPKDVMQVYDPNNFVMFKSYLWDNPFLPADYLANLQQLNPRKFEAWLNCSWDAAEDLFFGEWDKNAHTITTPTAIPPIVERFCAMKWSYGSTNIIGKGCLYWIACLWDSTYIVEDEFVFTETSIKDVATEYHKRNTMRGISPRWVVANRDLFKPGGENIAETFLRHDVLLMRANDDRVNGWMRVRAWLDVNDDGVAFLRVVAANCPYLCSTLPTLLADPAHTDDILPRQEANAADAIRYAAMSRPYPTPVQNDDRRETGFVQLAKVPRRPDIPKEALVGLAGGLRYAPGFSRRRR